VYNNVPLTAFVDALGRKAKAAWNKDELDIQPALDHAFHRPTAEWKPRKGEKLTLKRFFDKMAHFIPENAIVVGETGNALFGYD
jgi:indolepyruvate decarboxylase